MKAGESKTNEVNENIHNFRFGDMFWKSEGSMKGETSNDCEHFQ
jgi:hypothetical protein